MNGPERSILALWSESNINRFSAQSIPPGLVDSQIQLARTPEDDRDGFRSVGWRFLLTFFILLMMWPFAVWPAFAFLFRGGLGYWFSGIALVGRDGRPAGRFRCALREMLIWLPLTALLAGSLFLQWEWPDRVTLRTLFWLAGVASLPISFLIALRDPTRSPADRAAGVFLVPR